MEGSDEDAAHGVPPPIVRLRGGGAGAGAQAHARVAAPQAAHIARGARGAAGAQALPLLLHMERQPQRESPGAARGRAAAPAARAAPPPGRRVGVQLPLRPGLHRHRAQRLQQRGRAVLAQSPAVRRAALLAARDSRHRPQANSRLLYAHLSPDCAECATALVLKSAHVLLGLTCLLCTAVSGCGPWSTVTHAGQKYMSGRTGRVAFGQAGAATLHCDQKDYMFDWTMRITRHVHTYRCMRSWHTCTGMYMCRHTCKYTCTCGMYLAIHVHPQNGSTCTCTWHTCTCRGTCACRSNKPVCRYSDTHSGNICELRPAELESQLLPYGQHQPPPAPASAQAASCFWHCRQHRFKNTCLPD